MSRKSKAAEFLEEVYNITVTGRHVHVTQAMKDYAIERVSKIERFTNRILDVLVIMDIQKLEHRVDIVIKVDHTNIKSHASSTDMYVSIDMAVDKLRRQLLKYKSKLQDHHAKDVTTVDMNVNVFAPIDDLLEVNDEIQSETNRRELNRFRLPNVVSKERRPLKVLTVQEAIMKIDLSGDQFLVYRSEEDQRLKVIYRRNDGNYGVLEPEF